MGALPPGITGRLGMEMDEESESLSLLSLSLDALRLSSLSLCLSLSLALKGFGLRLPNGEMTTLDGSVVAGRAEVDWEEADTTEDGEIELATEEELNLLTPLLNRLELAKKRELLPKDGVG